MLNKSKHSKYNKRNKQNEYVSFRKYSGRTLASRNREFPQGTVLHDMYGVLVREDSEPVMTTHSENGRSYFAPNYDGNGIERGKLTHAIAYDSRRHRYGFRFNSTEAEWMQKNWPQYLQGGDTLLFNDAFFKAPITHLRAIADWLLIRFQPENIR